MLFQQSYGVTHLLFDLHTLCGAHWPRLLMDTSAILRKVLLMQILQKQNGTDRVQKKVLYSAFNRNILSVKTIRKHFCVVSNYVNGGNSGVG